MAECAIIFDVDGVLLDLTREEEEIFFTALSKYVPTQNLSRDWNSYKIRDDEDIVAEILEQNHLPAALLQDVSARYISLLKASAVEAVAIDGAAQLLSACQNFAKLGIATANLRAAAQHRLQQMGFWQYVAAHAFGADGGGHKSVILGRALESLNLPKNRIVYIGDNRNDVEAGLQHRVHFIGFSTSPERRADLEQYGATHISANHLETIALLRQMLA